MKVVIVGAGNVATVIGKKIAASGHEILQIVSRSKENSRKLSEYFNADFTDNPLFFNKQAEIILIAVTDHNISSVASQLGKSQAIVVHTAGSVSKDVLKEASGNYGVIYPLQTLNHQLQVLPDIPVLIDGNSDWVKERLFNFARSWATEVAFASDEQRSLTHIAGVMVNNFTNHLMALTEAFCMKEGVDFKLLLPLIRQTIERLGSIPASQLQTGPAARGDIAVIDKHLQSLNKYPALRNLYLKITESIIIHRKINSINI